MSKNVKIILIIIAILVAWVFIRLTLGGPEDDWICSNGEWTEHGAPSTPRPEGSCSWLDNFNPFK